MSKPIQIDDLGDGRWRCLIGGQPVRFRGSREAAVKFFTSYAARADARGLLRTEAGDVTFRQVRVFR